MDGFFEAGRDAIDLLLFQRATNYPAHFHRQLELIVADVGVNVAVNGVSHALGPDEWAVADSYDVHELTECRGADVLIVPTSMLAGFSALKDGMRLARNASDDRAVGRELRALAREAARTDRNPLCRSGRIEVLLGTIADAAGLVRAEHRGNDSVAAKLLRYLEEHAAEKTTLADAARALGYHPSSLSRLLRNTLHCSFPALLNRARLELYRRLRRERPDASVTALALDAGFGSASTFYRNAHSERSPHGAPIGIRPHAADADAEPPRA